MYEVLRKCNGPKVNKCMRCLKCNGPKVNKCMRCLKCNGPKVNKCMGCSEKGIRVNYCTVVIAQVPLHINMQLYWVLHFPPTSTIIDPCNYY